MLELNFLLHQSEGKAGSNISTDPHRHTCVDHTPQDADLCMQKDASSSLFPSPTEGLGA